MRRKRGPVLMRFVLPLLLSIGVTPFATGCSNAPEYCEKMCDCESCSDNKYDECIIAYEAWEDTASAYGCLDQFDALHLCTMNNNSCLADQFNPDVECVLDELVDYDQCRRANSSID